MLKNNKRVKSLFIGVLHYLEWENVKIERGGVSGFKDEFAFNFFNQLGTEGINFLGLALYYRMNVPTLTTFFSPILAAASVWNTGETGEMNT